MFSNKFNYNLIIYNEIINNEISYIKNKIYKTNLGIGDEYFTKENQRILDLSKFLLNLKKVKYL